MFDRPLLTRVMCAAWLTLSGAAIAQQVPSPATPTQPAAVVPEAEKKKEKIIDPDMLLHVGVGAGKVRGGSFMDDTGRVSGTIVGNPIKTSLGPGEGYRFNGTTDWLVCAPNQAESGAGLPRREFTVSAWVSLHETQEYGSIIGAIQDNGDAEAGWMLGYTHDAFYFALASAGADDGNGAMTYLKGTGAIERDRWYHVVGTYDGSSMKLFVNGEMQNQSREQSGDVLRATNAPYTIGCYLDDNEMYPMNGTLLEVRVLGRAILPQQVTEEFVPGVRLTSFQPEMEAEQRFVVKPYLQFATMDAMTFMFETSRPATGFVEFGESLPYTSISPPGSEGTLHEIRIAGLKPENAYFYRVKAVAADGGEIVSDDLTFRTAVLPDNPYAFTVIGDTQKNMPVIATLQAFAFTLRPNFQIHLGDVVDNGPDKDEWVKELLPASWPLMSRACMYPAIGNHEENHSNYYNYFALPSPECWYTYTYGNAQFFSLDTNKPVEPGSEQYIWLDKELSASKATWKFVYHHHPVYSSDENDFGDTYKEPSTFGDARHRVLAPLLEKHGVDIDFAGHVHCYERSWPLFQDKVDEAKGVRYITSGGGGGGLESAGPSRSWFAQRVYRGHHICSVAVHGKTLILQAFDLEGRLIDHMEIRKP